MMETQKKVILTLQQFIIERENANKRRQNFKDNNEHHLSLTQFHILELIANNDKANNKFLANKLNISNPAITKSIKKLLSRGLVIEEHNHNNKREIHYKLTEDGAQLSSIHDKLHQRAVKSYEDVLNVFDENELNVIVKFLERSIQAIKKEDADNNDQTEK